MAITASSIVRAVPAGMPGPVLARPPASGAFLVLCLLVAWPAATTTAASPHVSFARPKGERPADLGPRPTPAALDCAGAPVITVRAATDTVLAGSTTGLPNNSSGYGCVAWDESGGEAVYLLHVVEDAVMTATLTELAGGIDLDLFLLSSCDAADCRGAANAEFAATLVPGDYVLAVDGLNGSAGAYEVALRCRAAGVPESVCQGGAKDVPCATTATELDGSLFGQPDLIATYACSPFVESGGERWYALAVPDSADVTATVANETFDAALWLFDGCGPAPACLDFADAATAGGQETLTWRNSGSEQRTVYLAVDALRPPATEFDGDFQLTVTCSKAVNVPVLPITWGAVKAAYR
jgi:hypothetical protein